MAAPLVDRSTGDVIPATDHNDVKDYIEDGTYRVNSLSYNTQTAGEVISSAGVWTGGIIPVAKGGTGIAFFTPAGPSVARTYTFPDAAATILYAGGDAGTPSALVGTNISGTATNLTAGLVTGFTPASGSLTLAGADAVTITTTGVTNSTLPLGTKTLVATDVTSLSSLATVGTIGTGVWEATDVGVAHGGTGKSSWTQYLIPYADTTTSLSQIAIGTDGQVLTSAGAGVAPAFEDAGGGGALTLIETETFSGSTATCTLTATGYTMYVIMYAVSPASNSFIYLRVNALSDPDYAYTTLNSSTPTLTKNTGKAQFDIGNNKSGEMSSGQIIIGKKTGASVNTGISHIGSVYPQGTNAEQMLISGGFQYSTHTLTSLVFWSGANLTGTVSIYGVTATAV